MSEKINYRSLTVKNNAKISDVDDKHYFSNKSITKMRFAISFETAPTKARLMSKKAGEHVKLSQLDEDALQKRLLLTNSWISNCDQKAGLILAATSVILPIVVSNSVFLEIIQKNVKNLCEILNVYSLVFILTLALFIILLSACIFYLFKCLEGKVDSSVFSEKELQTESLLFFQTIAKKSFRQYKTEIKQINEKKIFADYLSQIYINSKICTVKFTNYNKGLKFLKWSLGVLVTLFVQIIL